MALGEMRHESALNLLFEEWKRNPLPESRKALALPIALSRLPQSLEFLVNVLTREPEPLASAALQALVIYRHDDTTRSRIQSALQSRNIPALNHLFEKTFTP